jgi:hypothetical protein
VGLKPILNFVTALIGIVWFTIGTSWMVLLPTLIALPWMLQSKVLPALSDPRYVIVEIAFGLQAALSLWSAFWWSKHEVIKRPRRYLKFANILAIETAICIVLQPFVFGGYRLAFMLLAAAQLIILLAQLFVCSMAITNEWL